MTAIESWIIDWREERLSARQWLHAALILTLAAVVYCLLSGLASGELSSPSISFAWGAAVVSVSALTCYALTCWLRARRAPCARLSGALLILIGGVALLVAGEKWLALMYWQRPWADFAVHFTSRAPLSLLILAVIALPSWLKSRRQPPSPAAVWPRRSRGMPPAVLEVQTRSGSLALDSDRIVRIVAAGNYMELHTLGGRYLLRSTLASLASRLAESGFVRAHRSILVNHRHVCAIKRDGKGEWVLHFVDGAVVRVGRRYRDSIPLLLELRNEHARLSSGAH